jgi:hypothetical protein
MYDQMDRWTHLLYASELLGNVDGPRVRTLRRFFDHEATAEELVQHLDMTEEDAARMIRFIQSRVRLPG